MKGISPEIWDMVVNGGRAKRLYICERDVLYFALYYFPDTFKEYALADYHYDFFADHQKLADRDVKEVAHVGFRESAKTTDAKIATTHLICFKKRKYINVDSYDKDNSKAFLYDIAIALQTNRRLVADFGRLYTRKRKTLVQEEEEEGFKSKKLGDFVTENDIKCEAFSTQESTRGRNFRFIYRPDHLIYDDIENNKTKESNATTSNIIEHLNEARASSSTASKLYLSNFLRDDGVAAHVIDNVKRAKGIVRFVPIMDPVTKEIAWKDKYVHTNEEANRLNAGITNPRMQKISLEAMREELRDPVFEAEMMLNPAKTGDLYFDRQKVLEAIEKAKAKQPLKDVGGFVTWEKYNPAHKYGGGADTAEGSGGDACTSAIIDFTPTPKQLVGIFANNEISPHSFAHEIAREGRAFGECFFVPEINNTGYATVAELISPTGCDYTNVYRRQVKNKTTQQLQSEFGWRTTASTKSDALGAFKSAFEDGDLVIWDIGLLTEMLYYRKSDALEVLTNKDGVTRHFDKLIATALAWEARKFAEVSEAEKENMYKAPKREAYQV